MAGSEILLDLQERPQIDQDTATASAISIWSIPQFEQIQIIFSHGLGQLHYHLALISCGNYPHGPPPVLTSSMVHMARAMNLFLRRIFAMTRRLEGPGRVVKSDNSWTWHAQPGHLWLRGAIADVTAKCDAFTGFVRATLQALASCPVRGGVSATTTTTAAVPGSRPLGEAAAPVLRSYNSFSSIGSETSGVRKRALRRSCVEARRAVPVIQSSSQCGSTTSTPDFSTATPSVRSHFPPDPDGLRESTLPVIARDRERKSLLLNALQRLLDGLRDPGVGMVSVR